MEILSQALAQREQTLATNTKLKKIIKDTKRTQKEIDDENSLSVQFKAATTRQQTKRISDLTYLDLSPSEVISARMTEVSYIYFRDGEHAAQLYVNKYLPGYKWDRAMTTEHIAVFVNKETGKIRVSGRGTQTAYDWKTNARLMTSSLGQSQQVKDMDKTLNEIFDKYGKENVEILSGHSKSGGTMFYFGEKYGIDTHLQDPAIPSNEIIGGKTKATHKISKTPADYVSAHTNIAGFRSGISITDVKAKSEGFKDIHNVDAMTGTNIKKKGNKVYNPELKNKAFLLSELQAGKTKEEIVKEVAYASKNSRAILRHEINTLIAEPESHDNILKDSGYVTQKPTTITGIAKQKVTEFIAPKVDAVAGKVFTKVAKTVSAGGVAGILSAVGAGQALHALGSENQIVNETAVGAISNASQDAAAAAFAQMRNKGHHIPIQNAIRNLPVGHLEELIETAERATESTVSTAAETTGEVIAETAVRSTAEAAAETTGEVIAETAVRSTAEAASEGAAASRHMSIGKSALRSLTRGGAAGLLGVGVQMGTQAVLEAIGLPEHAANIVSRLVGAAASGAVFGPVAAVVFTAIEGAIIAFEELWNWWFPHQPTEDELRIAEEQRVAEEARLAEVARLEEIRLAEAARLAAIRRLEEEKAHALLLIQQDLDRQIASEEALEQRTNATPLFRSILQADEQFLNARNYQEANNRIMAIINEMKDKIVPGSGWNGEFTGNEQFIFSLIQNGNKIIPQFDSAGNITLQTSQMSYFPKQTGEPPLAPRVEVEEVVEEEVVEEITEPTVTEPVDYGIADELWAKQGVFSDMIREQKKSMRPIEAPTPIETVAEKPIQMLQNYSGYGEASWAQDKPLPILSSKHKNDNRAVILNSLNRNPVIKKHLKEGNMEEVNKEIRNHFENNSHLSEYGGTVDNGDPHLPQINAIGTVNFQPLNKN